MENEELNVVDYTECYDASDDYEEEEGSGLMKKVGIGALAVGGLGLLCFGAKKLYDKVRKSKTQESTDEEEQEEVDEKKTSKKKKSK